MAPILKTHQELNDHRPLGLSRGLRLGSRDLAGLGLGLGDGGGLDLASAGGAGLRGHDEHRVGLGRQQIAWHGRRGNPEWLTS